MPKDVFELAGGWRLAAIIRCRRGSSRLQGKDAIGRHRGGGGPGRRPRLSQRTRNPLGQAVVCGADQIANEILCRDPEASVVTFRHGEMRHVFVVRQRLRPDAATAIATLLKAWIEVEPRK